MSTYDAACLDYVDTTARRSAERVIAVLETAVRAASILDVGCGQVSNLETKSRPRSMLDRAAGIEAPAPDREER